jgi:Flp pilus assembly pilin Flp
MTKISRQALSIIFITCISFLNAQVQIGSDIDGKASGDFSGTSVSINSNGTVVAIGSYGNDGNGSDAGHVRIYKNDTGVWTQIGADIDGEAANDNSGTSVSLSSDGSTVAIGAPFNNGNGNSAGHVRIFKNISGTWTQVGLDIDGESPGDYSGSSVSLSSDGSTVAIGAPQNDGNGANAGHVRIFKNISGTWTKIGSDIDGEAADDYSAVSVSLSSDGSTVAIGAPYNDGNGSAAGHVRIFKNISGTWTKIGSDIDGEAAGDISGNSVSLSSDGSTVAIGAPFNNGNGDYAGHVRIFKNISGTWTQVGSDIDGEAAYDEAGSSVSLSSDGSTVAIGAPQNDGNGANAGHVRIFKNISGTWTKIGSDIDGEAADDYSAVSVSLSSDGSTVAIGAPYNDGNGSAAGHVRIYKICTIDTLTESITACNSYTWSNGVTYTVSNNTAKDTFVNEGGCDSIVTLDLTINYSSDHIDDVTACDSFIWIDGETYNSNNNSATYKYINSKGCDSIITLNLTILNSSSKIEYISACDIFTSSTGKSWSSSGSYYDTMKNSVGCDSIINYQLTIIISDTIITLQPKDLIVSKSSNAQFMTASNDLNARFQWQTDLGFGFQNLSNAVQYSNVNKSSLTISNVTSSNNNQPFRCIVTSSNCSDTSEIATLTVTETGEIYTVSKESRILVYPNPTKGQLNIKTGTELIGSTFSIYNSNGELVYLGEIKAKLTIIELTSLADGIYLVNINGDLKQTFRVIKE